MQFISRTAVNNSLSLKFTLFTSWSICIERKTTYRIFVERNNSRGFIFRSSRGCLGHFLFPRALTILIEEVLKRHHVGGGRILKTAISAVMVLGQILYSFHISSNYRIAGCGYKNLSIFDTPNHTTVFKLASFCFWTWHRPTCSCSSSHSTSSQALCLNTSLWSVR